MKIVNNEDTYDYDVKVSYSKDDNYKIESAELKQI